MAGGYPKGSSRKPPPPSSSEANRKSRWDPAPSAAANQNQPSSSAAAKPNSADGASASGSKSGKPSSNNPNPSSDKKPIAARGGGANNPNPSPNPGQRSKPHPNSVSRGPIPSPRDPFSLPEPQLPRPPPPSYGFHMLERRTVVLADGTAHNYLALPPDYQDFVPPPRSGDPLGRFPPLGPGQGPPGRLPPLGPMSPDGFRVGEDQFGRNRDQDYWNSLGLDGRSGPPEGSVKRKYGEVEREVEDPLARQRQHVLQYGNVGAGFVERNRFLPGTSSPFRREDELIRSSKVMRVGGGLDPMGGVHHHLSVDQAALKQAFLKFAKLLNENADKKRKYLENGKLGPLSCVACERSFRDFPDVHGLIMHAYNYDNADLRVDHLGLHKALCVLMGWDYMKLPDNSRAYQFLPAVEAAANHEDLIMWPPHVLIYNASTGKGKDGRVEGLGNKAMDSIIRALGFPNGKSKSLYNKDGHLGIILVKFAADQSGLRDAIRMSEYFEKENLGRRAWAQVQSKLSGRDDENSPYLVKVDARSGEKKRIFYGHIVTGFDLDKIDHHDTKKKAVLVSKREYLQQR